MAPATATRPVTVQVGTTFRKHFADGTPLWKVTSIEGDFAYIEIVDEPITINGMTVPSDYAGTTDCALVAQIEKVLHNDAAMERYGDAVAQWWKSQADGTVLHYHDAFGRFVRGVVTRRNGQPELLPQALVGKWAPIDLVGRNWDGSARYGYHAKRVVEGEPWAPHASTIFEYQPSNYVRQGDPRTMEPIDLSVPTPSAEDLEQFRLNRIVQAAQDALGDWKTGTAERIAAAKAILEGA